MRFRCQVKAFPMRLVECVLPLPRGEALARPTEIVRSFAAQPSCCVGRSFGEQFQPAFKASFVDLIRLIKLRSFLPPSEAHMSSTPFPFPTPTFGFWNVSFQISFSGPTRGCN